MLHPELASDGQQREKTCSRMELDCRDNFWRRSVSFNRHRPWSIPGLGSVSTPKRIQLQLILVNEKINPINDSRISNDYRAL